MNKEQTRLRGSLLRLQRAYAKYYVELKSKFASNGMVSDIWAMMSNDMQAQADSLKKLHVSFWQSMARQEKDLCREVVSISLPGAGKAPGPLRDSLAESLNLEAPLTLKIYAQLIRRLRLQWTEQALDFYVMVRAHISRILQLIQLYAGDPDLVRRCTVLLQDFEREIQEPVAEVTIQKKPARAKTKAGAGVKRSKTVRSRKAVSKKASKPASSRARTAIAKRPKPTLVKKIEVARRRARR